MDQYLGIEKGQLYYSNSFRFDQITTAPIKLIYMPDPYELIETVIDEVGKSLKTLSLRKHQ